MQEKAAIKAAKNNILQLCIFMLFLYSENESENSAEKLWLVDHDYFHMYPPLFADDESENYDGTRQNSHNKRLRTNHCDNHSKPESRKIIAESAAAPPASSHKNTTTAVFVTDRIGCLLHTMAVLIFCYSCQSLISLTSLYIVT